jgi:hypothetical protein
VHLPTHKGKICAPQRPEKGRTCTFFEILCLPLVSFKENLFRVLNPLGKDDRMLFRAVLRGEYFINGFRHADKEYLPEFKYFKIAINEISKRDLVKIRNAVAAIFYIENSSAADMSRNWEELINLLKGVLKKDGIEIIRAILDRIFEIHNLPKDSKTIQKIEDLTEVKSMLELRMILKITTHPSCRATLALAVPIGKHRGSGIQLVNGAV